MIADQGLVPPKLGVLSRTVHNLGAFNEEIVAFVDRELLLWRQRTERPQVQDEDRLNEFLCDHLDNAARTKGFDVIRFTHQPHQDTHRTGDIAAKPCGVLSVEGRTYFEFEQLMPIECKRLPTPKGSGRGDIEYVRGVGSKRSGGIQRFKHGDHGAQSLEAIMIGYVQAESIDYWFAVVNDRLRMLCTTNADEDLWSPEELLATVGAATDPSVRRWKSQHKRLVPPSKTPEIHLHHLWIQMCDEQRLLTLTNN